VRGQLEDERSHLDVARDDMQQLEAQLVCAAEVNLSPLTLNP